MLIVSKEALHNARGQVREYAANPVIGYRRIADAGGIENLSLEQIKEFEYALLTVPILSGLGNYLDNAKLSKARYGHSPTDLVHSIADPLVGHIKEAYESTPGQQTIKELAKERAERLGPGLAASIYPVETVLELAGVSGADAMYSTAVSNAVAIHNSGVFEGLPRAEFIDAVKRSLDLPLTSAMMALRWHPIAKEATTEHSLAVLDDASSINPGALVYDPEKRAAKLTVPLEMWHPVQRPEITIAELQPEEERIGCPVSFDMQLVKRFYEHVVDKIEHHQVWPRPMADKRVSLLSLEVLHSLGIIPPED